MLHHNTLQDAWIVLNGEVLDVTRWIPLHPGAGLGAASVLLDGTVSLSCLVILFGGRSPIFIVKLTLFWP